MRIDYFIVSEKFKDRIVSCEIHGKGIELQGAIFFVLFLSYAMKIIYTAEYRLETPFIIHLMNRTNEALI